MKKMMQKTNKKIYTVTSTEIETPSVTTLRLSCEGEPAEYVPGQFITVYLPELGTPEGKAYSISSAPTEPISITVSARGDFSRRLCALAPGDTFLASAPSGYFYSESKASMLVMLAGGIGVAPFRSVMLDSVGKKQEREMHLFYSNKTVSDIVFHKTLDKLALEHLFIKVDYFITQEENIPTEMTYGRMSAETVLNKLNRKTEAEFFICGSISFVRDMWRGLKSIGVDEEKICTEAFF